MTKKENDIYMAGIVDGEGYVGMEKFIQRKKYIRYRIVCIIVNTNKYLMYWISINYKGYVYKRKSQGKNYKTSYVWYLYNDNAYKLFKKLYPYSIIKKKNLKSCINFREKALGRGMNKLKEKYWREIRSRGGRKWLHQNI